MLRVLHSMQVLRFRTSETEMRCSPGGRAFLKDHLMALREMDMN